MNRLAVVLCCAMALGAQEVTLLEITSAFSAFPNHGIRMEPYFAESITDRDGSQLEERRPQPKDAIRADTAFVMTNLLEGVVKEYEKRFGALNVEGPGAKQ